MHERWRHQLLSFWAHWISHRPRAIVAVSIVIAIGCVALSAAELQFKSNRNDLISPDLPWNKRFIDWQDSFPGSHDLVIVVDTLPTGPSNLETETPNGRQNPAFEIVDKLGLALQSDPLVEHVVWGFDSSQFSPKCIRMLPMEEFDLQLSQLNEAKIILENDSLAAMFKSTMRAMRQQNNQAPPSANNNEQNAETVEQIERLGKLVHAIGDALETPIDQPIQLQSAMEAQSNQPEWQYLQSDNGRLLFIRITPHPVEGELNALEPAIVSIRKTITDISAQYPTYEVGLTGIEVVEADETTAATIDSTKSSIIAFVFITLLLFTAFHSVRGPTLAMAALLIGVAWSFGFVTLAVGHLQVLSVVFTVILLGLGIAYGIHLASSFELARHNHDDTEEGFAQTLQHSFQVTGPGIITGAITTAGAFLTTVFTDFTGMAEMGLIASAGVILCLIAMFTMFPALLRIYKSRHKHFVPMDSRKLHFFEERWILPFSNHPYLTLGCALVLTLASGWWVGTSMQFDYDLMKLQPTHAPGVEWAQRIVTDGGNSIYFGVSLSDSLEEARQKAQQFRDQPTIDTQLGGVGLLFPLNEETKLQRLTSVRKRLQPSLDKALSDSPPADEPNNLIAQLGGIQFALQAAMFTSLPDEVRAAMLRASDELARVSRISSTLDDDGRARRLVRLDQAYRDFRQSVVQRVVATTDTTPLNFQDVPDEVLRSYRDDKGRLAMEVTPILSNGTSPLAPSVLPRFISAMETVDPNVTGVVVQVYESGTLIKEAYMRAGVFALVIVFVLVLLDFRNFHDAVLSLVPVAVGFTLTFAVMRALGMSINPANIMVLPLMFGIGVDDGVHVIHRYRLNPQDNPPGLTRGTGKGITITTLTTVIGFASLMLADHQGIKSLGFVLSTGIALTMISCWVIMPAWLAVRRNWQNSKQKN